MSNDCIKVSVSLPRNLVEEISREADSRGLSRSRMIAKACEFMLQVMERGLK